MQMIIWTEFEYIIWQSKELKTLFFSLAQGIQETWSRWFRESPQHSPSPLFPAMVHTQLIPQHTPTVELLLKGKFQETTAKTVIRDSSHGEAYWTQSPYSLRIYKGGIDLLYLVSLQSYV